MNIPCSDTPGTVQLTSMITSNGDESVALHWETDCPDGNFNDAGISDPILTFRTYTGDGVPVACGATLTVTYNGSVETSCGASVSVSTCQRDCLGVVNGFAVYDQCGLCNGDGTTCQCVNRTIHTEIFTAESLFGEQCSQINSMLRRYKKSCGSAGAAKVSAASVLRSTNSTCKSGKAIMKVIPLDVNTCDQIECTLTSNELTLKTVVKKTQRLHSLASRSLGLLASCKNSGDGVCRRDVKLCRQALKEREQQKRADRLAVKKHYTETLESLTKIPNLTYQCLTR